MVEPSKREIVEMGYTLAEMVKLGWPKSSLDALEDLYWLVHSPQDNKNS